MSSVAGEIRIDLLTNAARFKADMREAGRDGFVSFQEEFQKFKRGFDTQKQVMERSVAETRAWKSALADLNKDGRGLFNPQDLMLTGANTGKDQSLRNQMRWKEMLPWGNSMRVELSREAAETAAAIGDSKQKVIHSLASATRDIAYQVGDRAGLGGMVSSMGALAMGHPLITAGAIAGGFTLKTFLDRQNLAQNVRRESLMLGQGRNPQAG